jgi:hypothetical protein
VGEVIMGKGRYRDTGKIAFLLLLPVAVIVIWTGSGAADAAGEVELFERAYGYYLDYQPEMAASAFSLFLEKFGKSPAGDAALFWQAKSLALTGKTEEAKKIFSAIGAEYPDSAFGDFAGKALEALSLNPAQGGGASGAAKVKAKEGSGERGGERLGSETAKLAAPVKELSVRRRESEAKADGLAAEKDGTAAEIGKARRERDEAVAALRDAELKLSEANDVAARLREREKFQREQDEYIRKLKEEVRALAEGVKDRDGKLSEAAKTIALLREQLAAGGVAEIKTRDRQAERDNEEIRRPKKASEDTAREVEALTARLQGSEKALAEKDDLVKKMSADNAAYEGKLKEAEASAAEFKKVRGEQEKVKSEFAGAAAVAKGSGGDDSAEKFARQYAGLKQAYESLTERGKELEREIADLKERIVGYETPVVRIGEKSYTMIQVAVRSRLASAVLSKVGASPPWRKGDAFEDFITERLLLGKASDEDKSKAKEKAVKLAGKYSLDRGEGEYLTEYLTIEELLSEKKEGGVAGEDAIRHYYEANEADYLEKKEDRTVNYLVMRYHKGEKLGSVALVSELQREAASGRSFAEIARTRPGKVLLKRVKLDDLPGWIRAKIQVLKDGEISNIFTEDQFIMLQMRVDGPVYRKYEDVREEIKRKLSRKAERPFDLETWIAELRKEAVDIR